MENLIYLVPTALGLGGLGLAAFFWALKGKQFEDMEGAANRILFDDDQSPGIRPGDKTRGREHDID